MERTYKTWGEKWNIFQNDLCEVSILYLKPKQRCSWHRHAAKSNDFFVIEGKVVIKNEWGEVTVKQGETFTTRPGEWHEFQTGDEAAVLHEIMYVRYDPEDIERGELGGSLDEIKCEKCGASFPDDYIASIICCPECNYPNVINDECAKYEDKSGGSPDEGKQILYVCQDCDRRQLVDIHTLPLPCSQCGGTTLKHFKESESLDGDEPTALAIKLREVPCPSCGTINEYVDGRVNISCGNCCTPFIPVDAVLKTMP